MNTKYILYLIYGLLIAGVISSCFKSKCSKAVFEGHVRMSPWLDTFAIGDTFSIRISFKNQDPSINPEAVLDMDKHDKPTKMLFSRIDTFPSVYANHDFMPQSQIGNLLYNQSAPIIGEDVVGEPGSYFVVFDENEFQAKFTALSKGMFMFNVFTLGDIHEQSNFGRNCSKYYEVKYVFENGDAYENNFEMLQDAPWEGFQTLTPEKFGSTGASYVFVVKE